MTGAATVGDGGYLLWPRLPLQFHLEDADARLEPAHLVSKYGQSKCRLGLWLGLEAAHLVSVGTAVRARVRLALKRPT